VSAERQSWKQGKTPAEAVGYNRRVSQLLDSGSLAPPTSALTLTVFGLEFATGVSA
jgi:hypothetical protein